MNKYVGSGCQRKWECHWHKDDDAFLSRHPKTRMRQKLGDRECETEILPARKGEWGVTQGEIYSNLLRCGDPAILFTSSYLLSNHRAALSRLWRKCRSQELQTWQHRIPWPLQCLSEAAPVLLNNRLSSVLETQQGLTTAKLSSLPWKHCGLLCTEY